MQGIILKWVFLVALLFNLVACKSTKNITDNTALDASLKSKTIIANHYGNIDDFKTLRGRVKIRYEDGDKEQGIGVSFRMEKDKAIWISAPLGMVKAYITPKNVSFYNKLEKEYFEGDFSYLSEMLGTDLDFNNVQNLLLGNAFQDLRNQKYEVTISENNYQLTPKKGDATYKILYLLNPSNFKISRQQVAQTAKNRLLKIDYNYQSVESKVLPKSIAIVAEDADDKRNIDLTYNNMEFNQKLNFPYKIPNGYKQISLGK